MKLTLQHRPLNDRGYTLPEAMIVVALVALMTGYGYSGFNSWMRKENVRSAANLFAGHLREARIRSIEKHVSYAVIFSYDANEYRVFTDTYTDPEEDGLAFNPDQGELKIFDVSVCQNYNGVAAKCDSTSETEFKISFDVRGFPQSPDAILFYSDQVEPDRIASTSSCTSLSNGTCCAVDVSYGDITVSCNDGY